MCLYESRSGAKCSMKQFMIVEKLLISGMKMVSNRENIEIDIMRTSV